MKTLLLSLIIILGFAPKADAHYFAVHCRPCPVAAFNGSASQTSPFQCWYLNTAANYAYYYYNNLYWGAYNRYWSEWGWNGYYWCDYWRVRTWLITNMECAWRND